MQVSIEVKPSIGTCFDLPFDLNPKTEAILISQNL